MSIPREVTLRKIDGELRMCQQPVREIETLRDVATTLSNIAVRGLLPVETKGQQLEIQAEFEVGGAKEFGVRVLKGGEQQTVVGYDVAAKTAFIDRTKSGNVGFHPAFAGRHAGPLTAPNGRIRLRILVDRSSVEVFGNDGETAITDLVFPDETSDGVEVYAEGGEAKLVDWKAWTLKSVWGK
jgi:sucrose-6-phosphate hydrolase SacC (GH32 family)